jgi:hypothetical protein
VSELGGGPVYLKEDVLSHVLGILPVAQQTVAGVHHLCLIAVNQCFERLVIASRGLLD